MSTPDFDSAKAFYWMHATKEAMKTPGAREKMPRKERKGLREVSYWGAVDRRLSRRSFTVNVTFDKDGKVIKHERVENE
jgi:hypothetical protein